MLIHAQNVEKYFGDKLIIKFEDLKIYRGDKIGIVGDNGSGKTTLLKILTNNLSPDSGNIKINAVISYQEQLSLDNANFDIKDSIHASIFAAKHDAVSGGEIMRKKLAAVFSASPDILALDEPTSNLDIDGISVLNSMLLGVETLLLISHDRSLLDAHCNKIIEIRDGKIKVYPGNFSQFQKFTDESHQQQIALYDRYIGEKARLMQSSEKNSAKAKKMKKTPSRMGNSEARLHRRETTQKQQKVQAASSAIQTRLEKLEVVTKVKEPRLINPDFSLTDPPRGKIVISFDNLNFSYGDKIIFKDAQLKVENGSHLAITGENGSGKSTLLRLIATLKSDITYAPKIKIGYMSQNFSSLCLSDTVLETVTKTAVQSLEVCRNVLANMGFLKDSVTKKIDILSGGELVKLYLACLIVSDCNTLVLDEPTNYLDITSIIAVQKALQNFKGTIIFVTHDNEFVKNVADSVVEIRDKKVCLLKN